MARGKVVHIADGDPGVTTRVSTTDSAQSIPSGIKILSNKKALAVTITFETENVRVALGTSPTQGASGIGHVMFPGDVLILTNPRAIAGSNELKFISASNGLPGALMISAEY